MDELSALKELGGGSFLVFAAWIFWKMHEAKRMEKEKEREEEKQTKERNDSGLLEIIKDNNKIYHQQLQSEIEHLKKDNERMREMIRSESQLIRDAIRFLGNMVFSIVQIFRGESDDTTLRDLKSNFEKIINDRRYVKDTKEWNGFQ